MRIGEEHCRDQINDPQETALLRPHVGFMRRLRDEEHTTCMCGGMWMGNGYARMLGNKLLDHLICTRCGIGGSPTTTQSRRGLRFLIRRRGKLATSVEHGHSIT